MHQDYLAFQDTGYFSSLICDYLQENDQLKHFYNKFPTLENFNEQIKQKATSKIEREELVTVLKSQYENISVTKSTSNNIESLRKNNTFTITTGHQLNLFTGPLYFLYKIVSTINLCKILKSEYPEFNFVPIYWMATEDHDFEEINYFNFKGKKFKWNLNADGAVGELTTEGLKAVYNLLSKEFGNGQNAKFLKSLFEKSYLHHKNLADATRHLANELFADQGLVILDANNAELKRLFIPYMKEELLEQLSSHSVLKTNKALSKISEDYNIQVNPREINLFYLDKNLRERIVFEDGIYYVLNSSISWKEKELIKHLEEFPERFSPNVIMRPLYQEVILPNLCYIGGGGELAYWLQLKHYFEEVNVSFPMLLLRNSVLIKSKSQSKKLDKLKISDKDIFLEQEALINKKVRQISNIDIDFSPQKEHLIKQFQDLYSLAERTDKSFIGAVKAQEVKQLKGLDNLEKRLLKAQKRKLSDEVERMVHIQNELFPNGNLQERTKNFSEFYLEYGNSLKTNLIQSLDPLNYKFSILTMP